MKLAQWLRKENVTQADFARRVGVARSAVHKWLNGERPSERNMAAIYRETGGEVTPNDFYALRRKPQRREPPSAAEIFDREVEAEAAIYAGTGEYSGPLTEEERRLRAIDFLQEVIRDLDKGKGKDDG